MALPSRHIIYNELYQKESKEYKEYLLLLGYADDTCQSKYLYLKEFFNWLEEIGIYQLHHITAVETGNFYEYIQNRKSTRTGQELKQKSVYDIMRCAQQYLGYALHLGKIKINPASHLKFNYPNEEVNRIIFTQEEIRELYEVTETEQERTILHIAYGCGLRANEVSQLNKEDLRLTENLVIVQKGKNSKRRLVPINDTISQELQEFIFSSETKQKAVFLNSKGGRMQEWTLNKQLKKNHQTYRLRESIYAGRINQNRNAHIKAQYSDTSFRERNAVRTSTIIFRTQPYRKHRNLYAYQSKSNQ